MSSKARLLGIIARERAHHYWVRAPKPSTTVSQQVTARPTSKCEVAGDKPDLLIPNTRSQFTACLGSDTLKRYHWSYYFTHIQMKRPMLLNSQPPNRRRHRIKSTGQLYFIHSRNTSYKNILNKWTEPFSQTYQSQNYHSHATLLMDCLLICEF